MKKQKGHALQSLNVGGFTIIELLVVVSVVAVLSGISLSVLNSKGVQAKARDSQRIGDLKQIQTALELYFADNRGYPVADTWVKSTAIPGLSPSYINSVPSDPKESGDANPCSGGGAEDHTYSYRAPSPGGTYILTAMMEVEMSNNESTCASTPGWSIGFCQDIADYCYGVSNP